MKMRRYLLPLMAGILLALPAAAHAVSFGPDLTTASPNNPYTCGSAGDWSGCTIQDPMSLDMENVLPDPISHGNQTGVVTDMHVLSAGTTQAQFVVVEWSGQPGLGQPFPSGVMALSDVVTLHPGMNNFNTNLPVDFRLAPNGFESWSDIALTLFDPTAPIPAQLGGTYATTGLLSDNGNPLTQVTPDLTVPPHNVAISGFPPATLLMSGDVTITTGQTPVPPPPPPTPVAPAPRLTFPTAGRFAKGTATVLLHCAAGANCSGTLSISSRAPQASRKTRPVTYGTAAFSIPAGGAKPTKVAFTRAGRRAIGNRRTLHAYLIATFTSGGTTTPATAPITLRRQQR
jgi:hypothetical protein